MAIGLVDGLFLDGTKPLPEPKLTFHNWDWDSLELYIKARIAWRFHVIVLPVSEDPEEKLPVVLIIILIIGGSFFFSMTCTFFISWWLGRVRRNEGEYQNRTLSFKTMCLKMSSEKWCPFCLGLNVLSYNRKFDDYFYKILWCELHIYFQCIQRPNILETIYAQRIKIQ